MHILTGPPFSRWAEGNHLTVKLGDGWHVLVIESHIMELVDGCHIMEIKDAIWSNLKCMCKVL